MIVDLFYLPPLEFFVAIMDQKLIYVEACDRYDRQSFRNRTRILMANKVETLSIPVSGGRKKLSYKDIKIDNHQKWLNNHLRGIQSAYGKSPFFEYYFPYFEKIYLSKKAFLFDFNLDLLTVCLKLLGMSVKIRETVVLEPKKTQDDLRGMIHVKEGFEQRTIYSPTSYMQMFGADFVPNLSVIDLLFCEGPNSADILVQSKKND
ncbi:WbqC family protein [Pararhodonellum marinum]|uniref:WbqC family protein n=1 Tax=Pararhodonellum marinum TaxID=2755358 RepID=UPI00188E8A61|nr:WbqC family protein [Pararhodonellum marinum]